MQMFDDGVSHDQIYGSIRNAETFAGITANLPIEQGILLHLIGVYIDADQDHVAAL